MFYFLKRLPFQETMAQYLSDDEANFSLHNKPNRPALKKTFMTQELATFYDMYVKTSLSATVIKVSQW